MITFTILLPAENAAPFGDELKKYYGDCLSFEIKAAKTQGNSLINGVLFGAWEIFLGDRIKSQAQTIKIHDYELKESL